MGDAASRVSTANVETGLAPSPATNYWLEALCSFSLASIFGWLTAGRGSVLLLLLRHVFLRRLLGCWFRVSRSRRHGALGIQQVIGTRPKSKLNQGARVGRCLRLPSVIRLEALHGCLRGAIPGSRSFALQVVFADQCHLNFAGAPGIDRLLPTFFRAFLSAS